MPMVTSAPSTLRWQPPWAWLLAAALVLLRAVYLPRIELFPEEAYYWNYAQHLDYGYLDHPPMVAWLIALSTHLFGQTEFAVRLPAFVCSLGTSFFTYRCTRLFYGGTAASYAVLLTQLLPFFFAVGSIMTSDAPLTACWAGALYYFARVFLLRSSHAWIGVGVCMGLGMLSKYTVALLGPAALLFLLLDAPSRAWLRHAGPYAGTILATAIFSPVVVWNACHGWASFAFQSSGRLAHRHHFSLPALLGSICLMLTPLGLVLAGRLARRGHRDGQNPQAKVAERLFVWVFTLVPLSVFVVFSLAHQVKLNWTGPLWLALVPAFAAELAGLESAANRWTPLRLAWLSTQGVLVVSYSASLQYLSFGLPGVRYRENIALLPVGWSQMSQELEHEQADLRQRSEGLVLIVGMDRDFIASEAAFYHSRRPGSVDEVTGAHLFGSESLMYRYWFPPAELDGASLVLASFNGGWLDAPSVRKHCAALEAIQSHEIVKNGRAVCAYYTRIVQGYHAELRKQTKGDEPRSPWGLGPPTSR